MEMPLGEFWTEFQEAAEDDRRENERMKERRKGHNNGSKRKGR